MNHGGEVALTTYGRTSGFCIDPIEKKPLNHFFPGSSVLSFGTAGCNLTCKFCQNWDISKSRDGDRLAEEATPEMIASMARARRCKSVAYTYNDPVIFFEYAIDTAQACHELGIKSVAVTAGYMNEKPREEFFRSMDAANVDLKSFSERFYHTVCGGHVQPVLDTLLYVKNETRVWLEITTLLIPDANDSEKELEELTQWIVTNLGVDVPMHFYRLPSRLEDDHDSKNSGGYSSESAGHCAKKWHSLRLHRKRLRSAGTIDVLPSVSCLFD